ncbi:MAG: MBL fold metallo-hydrolase [Pseudomonadota bacterium]
MNVIIAGSGTGIPLKDRASPSIILFPKNGPVLMDMGPGTLRRLAGLGIPHDRLRQIFITHFHPDHTADLIAFLFATRNPSVLKKRAPFRITGPRGLGDFLLNLQKIYQNWVSIPPEIMEIEELNVEKPGDKTYGDFKLSYRHVSHNPESLAYRIEGPLGESLVYSGDTGPCDEIIDLSRKVDMLILECSFPEGREMEGHLTPGLAGSIAAQAKARKLVLLHFYPEVLITDIVRDCRKAFGGELIVGRDSLHLSV